MESEQNQETRKHFFCFCVVVNFVRSSHNPVSLPLYTQVCLGLDNDSLVPAEVLDKAREYGYYQVLEDYKDDVSLTTFFESADHVDAALISSNYVGYGLHSEFYGKNRVKLLPKEETPAESK